MKAICSALLLAGATSAFVITSTTPAQRLCQASKFAVQASAANDEVSEEERLAGIEKFRERAKMRAEGKPLKEWGQGADPADNFVAPPGSSPPPGQDGFTPPTEDQKEAADALFGKLLSSNAPDDFGEGLDSIINGGSDES